MSARTTETVLSCDNDTVPDHGGERHCENEFTYSDNANATRNAAAACGWARVNLDGVVLDICPDCYR
jgi:hypothetical protein